jgi:NagD protein
MDMDGTIYRGATLFPWTLPWLDFLRAHGIGFTFLTNNSSKSRQVYLDKLADLGIQIEPAQMYTSTWNTVDYLRQEYAGQKRLFILGTPSLRAEMAEAGFTDVDDNPEVVVVGFDTGLSYERLCRAGYWIRRGRPFIATHPDVICPTDEETLLVDCGSICACLTAATLRSPDKVLGKPNPEMLWPIATRHGLQSGQILMIGDRLQTDILLAANAGALSCKVANPQEDGVYGVGLEVRPDLSVEHLGDLHALMADALGAAGRGL